MSKLQLALVSLVAALPAGFLSYQLVMVFLNNGGGPSVMYQAIVGMALACSVVLALMPVLVLALYSTGIPAPAKAKKADAAAKAAAADAADVDEADALDEPAGDIEDLGELPDEEFEEAFDDAEEELFDEEEEEAPKKKKKKR